MSMPFVNILRALHALTIHWTFDVFVFAAFVTVLRLIGPFSSMISVRILRANLCKHRFDQHAACHGPLRLSRDIIHKTYLFESKV